MLFRMGARARVVDEIVDSNTLFSYLMRTTSAHFTYVDLYRQLLSNCCTCPGILSLLCSIIYINKFSGNDILQHGTPFPWGAAHPTLRGDVRQPVSPLAKSHFDTPSVVRRASRIRIRLALSRPDLSTPIPAGSRSTRSIIACAPVHPSPSTHQ